MFNRSGKQPKSGAAVRLEVGGGRGFGANRKSQQPADGGAQRAEGELASGGAKHPITGDERVQASTVAEADGAEIEVYLVPP